MTRRLLPIGVVAAVVALIVGGLAFATVPSVDVPTCAKPTGSVSHAKLLAYIECRSDRIEALLANQPTETPKDPEPTDPTPTDPPTTDPTDPPATEPPASEWPGPDNTGVPAGTNLTAYTGPCTITSSITIDAKDVAGKCGELIVRGNGITVDITRSNLPRVENTTFGQFATINITDSDVSSPTWYEGVIWGANFTVTRADITGGQHSVHCDQGNCTIVDSWLHDQFEDPAKSFHNNAFIANGGSGYTLRGNTLHCTADLNSNGGGCTADVSLFGDFSKVSDVLVEGNLMKANNRSISFCAYGGYEPSKPHPVSTQIRFIDNVFERGANNKCGVYGPVSSFQPTAAGNVWSGNTWSDGTPLNP